MVLILKKWFYILEVKLFYYVVSGRLVNLFWKTIMTIYLICMIILLLDFFFLEVAEGKPNSNSNQQALPGQLLC